MNNPVDRKEIEDLINEHRYYVFCFIKSKCSNQNMADDIVQDAVIKVLGKYHQLKEVKYFKSWFAAIAHNTMLNSLRKHKHEIFTGKVPDSVYEHNFVDDIDRSRTLKTIEQKANRLPKKQKRAFKLRFNDGLDFRDIAEIMNCPYDTAKANYLHAEIKIKKHFGLISD